MHQLCKGSSIGVDGGAKKFDELLIIIDNIKNIF